MSSSIRQLGVCLRQDADGGVGDEDEDDDTGLDHRGGALAVEDTENKGHDGGGDENLHEKIVELLQDELQKGVPGSAGNSLVPCRRRAASASRSDRPTRGSTEKCERTYACGESRAGAKRWGQKAIGERGRTRSRGSERGDKDDRDG